MANTTYTPLFRHDAGYGRQVLEKLRVNNRIISPALIQIWRGPNVTHADLTAAATSEELDLNTLAGSGREFPANCMVLGWILDLKIAFAGGSVSAITVEGGDTGDPDEGFTAENVFTGATAGFQTLVKGAAQDGVVQFEAAYAPVLRFAATGDDVVNLTSGSLVPAIMCIPIERLRTD